MIARLSAASLRDICVCGKKKGKTHTPSVQVSVLETIMPSDWIQQLALADKNKLPCHRRSRTYCHSVICAHTDVWQRRYQTYYVGEKSAAD